MTGSKTTVKTAQQRRRSSPGALMLLVAGEGHVSTHAVAPGAELVLGRDPDCEVPLVHPKISRRHAAVRGGPPCTIEDLGSTNGVRLGARALGAGERAELAAGDSFNLGPFSVLVLDARAGAAEAGPGRAALVVRDPRAAVQSDVVGRIAASDVSIVIRGETGAGKEVLAVALHGRSGRSGPLVSVNCAALSESLFESEIFGHERGAFTGAVQAKPGLLETAAHGTLFLDEIGELPLALQAKLLRAIETKQALRVGGTRPVVFDVRFLAATHRDLAAEAARGSFRQDLYFRLNGVTLVVPPLRARRDAIAGLAQEFLADVAARSGAPAKRLSPGALAALARHGWPGNVRELKAVVERAVLLASRETIDEHDIDLEPPAAASAPAPSASTPAERERIVAALEQCAGNQTRAARMLGISRATLTHKLALYAIPRPRR